MQTSPALGATHHVAIPGWARLLTSEPRVHRLVVDQHVDGHRRTPGVGCRRGGRSGHGQQGIDASLWFGAGHVVGSDDMPSRSRASAQSVSHSAATNQEKISMNSAPPSSGSEPATDQPPSGDGRRRSHVEHGQAFVAEPITVGVGERLPHADAPVELVERQRGGVVEQHRLVAVQHIAGDAWVGGDPGHQLRLGNTDRAVALGFAPLGNTFVQAGGLEPPECFGARQLQDVLEHGSSREESLLAERVRTLDTPRGADPGGVDHAAGLLDAFQQTATCRSIEGSGIEARQLTRSRPRPGRRQPRRAARRRSARPLRRTPRQFSCSPPRFSNGMEGGVGPHIMRMGL